MTRDGQMPQRPLESPPEPTRIGSLYDHMLERMTDHVVRWRSLAVLFFVGGRARADSRSCCPRPTPRASTALAVIGATATVSGLADVRARRAPARVAHVACRSPSAPLLVTLGVIATQDTTAIYALFYVWVGFEAFFFLPRRQAIAHIAFVAVAYAVALSLAGGAAPDARRPLAA